MNKIGKYRIRGLLGRGGMSKVYKVEIPVIGKIAALKMFDPNPLLIDLMGHDALRELFVSEAVTMAGLRHPHIVDIWDFGEQGNRPFYLMHYYCNNLGTMIGETYMTDQPSRIIAVDKAVGYTQQILLGLAALHHAGIIHRDIKPFNVLITDQDTVKISDFGLSKLRGETFKGPSNLNVGSPWYAPPEQEKDPDHVDFSADLYPVGVMLYRMLTGRLPEDPADPPSRINPDIDPAWNHFFEHAMAVDPVNRFSSANDMLAALEDLYASWNEKKERICRIQENSPSKPTTPFDNRVRLRTRPEKLGPRQAKRFFLLDELWRPQSYPAHHFERPSNETVVDRTTELVWQRSGSPYPVTWQNAREYVTQLNEAKFGGYAHWRLPTVSELVSLITETPHQEALCIEPVFDTRQKWIWTCDRRSFTAAWYVSVDLGFVSWQDATCCYYARAVCSM